MESAAEPSNSSLREWLYIDSSGLQKGPVPANVLERLLEKGVGISANTLVWKAGMTTWLPLAQVEPFKAVADFQVKQWYYIDQDRQTLGPIPSKELVAKIQVGEVDGLSLIFGSGLDSWKPLGEIAELKAIIQKLAEEEDVAAIASDKSVDLTDQVYALESEDKTIDKDRYQKELAYMAELSRQKKEKEVASKENQRIYWDDAEQSWVEKEDDEIVPGEDSTLEQASKRRRTIDNDQNDFMQEDEEEEEEDGAELTVTSDQQSAAAKKKRKKRKNKKAQKNWVYITGLPADVTAEEINAHFSKVGIIEISPYDQLPKIRVYRDEEGNCKGDCSLCYNAEGSAKTAIEFLDGGYIRPSHKVTVTQADFTSNSSDAAKSSNDSRSAGKPKLSQAQMKVAKSAMKQALAWNEDDDIGVSKSSALKIVVIEGMFEPKDFDSDPNFEKDLEQDIVSACEECGAVEKLTVFSQNPRGIAIVKFATSYAAQECTKLLNGRFYAKRKLRCYFWDGVTNYSITAQSVQDVDQEEQVEKERLDEFGDWLEDQQEELPDEFKLQVE